MATWNRRCTIGRIEPLSNRVGKRLVEELLILLRRRSPERMLRGIVVPCVFEDQIGALREMLTMVRKAGRIVSCAEALAVMAGRVPLSGRVFFVTFDGGYAEHYHNALPVIEEMGIPACFFVSSGFVGAEALEAAAFAEERLHCRPPLPPVTWRQVRDLAGKGYEIGSQTAGHGVLSRISPEEQSREISTDKARIEHETGRLCRFLAWPHGTRADVDEHAVAAAGACGFQAAYMSSGGCCRVGDDPLRARREKVLLSWRPARLRYHVLFKR